MLSCFVFDALWSHVLAHILEEVWHFGKVHVALLSVLLEDLELLSKQGFQGGRSLLQCDALGVHKYGHGALFSNDFVELGAVDESEIFRPLIALQIFHR